MLGCGKEGQVSGPRSSLPPSHPLSPFWPRPPCLVSLKRRGTFLSPVGGSLQVLGQGGEGMGSGTFWKDIAGWRTVRRGGEGRGGREGGTEGCPMPEAELLASRPPGRPPSLPPVPSTCLVRDGDRVRTTSCSHPEAAQAVRGFRLIEYRPFVPIAGRRRGRRRGGRRPHPAPGGSEDGGVWSRGSMYVRGGESEFHAVCGH